MGGKTAGAGGAGGTGPRSKRLPGTFGDGGVGRGANAKMQRKLGSISSDVDEILNAELRAALSARGARTRILSRGLKPR